nr:PREDICTED: succinate-semialdehyde dehydrogenase, mitochondrial-like isoform X2 [Saccoglossus kowalevskii]
MSSQSPFIRDKAYIGGKWVAATNGGTFEVKNPATGEHLGVVPDMTESDAVFAIKTANEAFQSWKSTLARERTLLLRRLDQLMHEHKDSLAKLISLEMGKPIKEAKGEIMYAASMLEWFAEESRRIYGDVIAAPTKSKRLVVIKQPLGVASLITPWNFPCAMITRKAAAALAAGCTVVVKPSEDTPYSALALAQLTEEAGFPAGVFNVITSSRSNAAALGHVMCTHPMSASISFTGSTEVGKILMREAAEGIKRVALELGGHAPFIVFESADIDAAVVGAMMAKFRNCGQACVGANRFLIHSSIYDKFCSKLADAMKSQLVIGDSMDESVTIGPLINERAVEKVEKHIKDAVDNGASIVVGGDRNSRGNNYINPTLLRDVKPSMLMCQEETFGPVAPLIKFDTEEEAVSIANDTRSGLAGYFYTTNLLQAWRVAEALECGLVGINEGLVSTVESPFQGFKESGIGSEASKYGIEEYLEKKTICFGGL